MTDLDNCINCEFPLKDNFGYCPNCGQKTKEDLTMGVLFSNTISNYFSVDARFFKSFVPLMFKPGILARRFVDGKRKAYLHPAQFYLFISVVFFFLFSIVTRKQNQKLDNVLRKGFDNNVEVLDSIKVRAADSIAMERASQALKQNQKFIGMSDKELKILDSVMKLEAKKGKNGPNIMFNFNREKLDSVIAAGGSKEDKLRVIGLEDDSSAFARMFAGQILKLYEQKAGGVLKAFYDTIPIAMFFLLPVFAMILKIFYLRRGRFAHHMVFSFYYFTFMFVTLSFLVLCNLLFDMPGWIQVLIILSTFIYLWLSMRYFYKQNYFLTWIKASMVTFIYLMFVLPLSVTAMIFISFVLY
ncbi:DUF3667 domain-containing protein [Sungkyunkwania multivorans]|uniref:DUF3667 domain-containing protein n=1 Tax=Sungkyunkwania multivorans TaxID=1173618 RepID=A0ABW3CWY7_9FLAO